MIEENWVEQSRKPAGFDISDKISKRGYMPYLESFEINDNAKKNNVADKVNYYIDLRY